MEAALGCVDPDKSLKNVGFRIFSRAFDHADSEYAIYFAVRPREDRAHFISMHGKMHYKSKNQNVKIISNGDLRYVK